jgi:hypothetical protein
MTPKRRIPSTQEKALQINLEGPPYGTLAEIGGGQEVANHFFHVGAASGTIAKSISAYDMVFSDAIYGPTRTGQYVCRERLEDMLELEYKLLLDRLDAKRGAEATFFSFANTVRARAYGDKGNECHGWMGVRFQSGPRQEPNEILVHVRLLDEELLDQQQVLGVLGVNLIFAMLYLPTSLALFTESLIDNIRPDRVEIDLLKFSGPTYAQFDNRLAALQLVESGLTASAFFTTTGEVMQASEVFYKKPILLLRGRFDPVTNTHLDMLKTAEAFMREKLVPGDTPIMEIMELTMTNLLECAGARIGISCVDPGTFLARADILQALGKNVLISKFPEFHRLGAFLCRYTKEPIGIVLGTSLLEELFQERWYESLAGGILESFGRLFKHSLRLLVYPEPNRGTTELRHASEAQVAPHLRHLFAHLLENQSIAGLTAGVENANRCSPSDIRLMMENGDPAWIQLVPQPVVTALAKAM